ncbi:MAG: FMN-binding glutamate synthase family protein [Acidimicrobiales bacterium]|nr:FMN-binding glutamate synthase family protein [Acidimicrobiales bacterium]
MWFVLVSAIVIVLLAAIGLYDVTQRKHAILRNFPVVGHLRYILEKIGPELRQYIVTDNDEERPFSRDQRRWVYSSAKRENDYFGFGTDNDFERPAPGYVIVKHSAFPHPPVPADADPSHPIPAAKVVGAWRGRPKAFRPASVVNISGMSYGSLSGAAVEALNRGAQLAGCWQSTGEGGLSSFHRHGGDLLFQIGTGYFGVRDAAGRFDLGRLVELCEANPVRAIEVKLSQGAKPGLGGMLPGAKVNSVIAGVRGIEVGKDCISPAYHQEFSDVDGMLAFIERVADATGVPVGIKSAVGDDAFWVQLAQRMVQTGTGPDFVVVDGGEGGTGAGPLAFTDHVSLPFRIGFPRVYKAFAEVDLHHKVAFGGSAKLGFPEAALLALALGCDWISVAREAMLAIGCVQAQRCHTDHCPTGVATQRPWLARGLDPDLKSVRCANYLITLRKELLRLAHACGVSHPSLVGLERLDLLGADGSARSAAERFGYQPGWGLPAEQDIVAVEAMVSAAGELWAMPAGS